MLRKEDLLLNSVYLGTICHEYGARNDSILEVDVHEQIREGSEFEKILKSYHSKNQIPVFGKVSLSNTELNMDSTNHCGIVFNGEAILNNITVTSRFYKTNSPRIKIRNSQINGELSYNNFQRASIRDTMINDNVNKNDFRQANLVNSLFSGNITDCNFCCAKCNNTVFKGNIDGFTCFAGADLTGADFLGKIGDKVCFIGSNIGEQKNKPKGGIQTIGDLKKSLPTLTTTEVATLHDILKQTHQQVTQTYSMFTRTGLEYHINMHHVDSINEAVGILEEELGNRKKSDCVETSSPI